MEKKHNTELEKDLSGRRIMVTRLFDAPVGSVWRAWTEQELLERWWAPKPYTIETKTFSFTKGGSWLYAMVAPDQARHWARLDFKAIDAPKSYEVFNGLCDELGVMSSEMPSMNWRNEFYAAGSQTKVLIHISFDKKEDMEKILEMGFEEGFSMALSNLDEYFAGTLKK